MPTNDSNICCLYCLDWQDYSCANKKSSNYLKFRCPGDGCSEFNPCEVWEKNWDSSYGKYIERTEHDAN